jgi:hypothetical protein
MLGAMVRSAPPQDRGLWSRWEFLVFVRAPPINTTLKILARTGVFVLVVFALKRSINGHGRQPRMILTEVKYKQSRSYQKNDLRKEFH